MKFGQNIDLDDPKRELECHGQSVSNQVKEWVGDIYYSNIKPLGAVQNRHHFHLW